MSTPIDHLVFRAKLEPGAVALQRPDRHLTFAQLLFQVRSIAGKLRQVGVKPGQVAVTLLEDKFLDWIMTLALCHEATSSCSILHYDQLVAANLDYDWIITERDDGCCQPGKTIRIDKAWLADLLHQSYGTAQVDHELRATQQRVVLTSGTTGSSKAVTLSYALAVDRAIFSLQYMLPVASCISMLPLSTWLGMNNALASLVKGVPLYCARSAGEVIASINRFSIEAIHGSVTQLSHLVKGLGRTSQQLPSVKTVIYAGGAASPAFLANVARQLTGNIYNDYGSTETAGVCTFKPNPRTDPATCGYALPGTLVEVVGESHQPLPRGEEGLLRLRSPHMVGEYFRDPQATGRYFRDGWFYPGDRGRLMKDGLLMLTGRDSELINLGGVKIDPAQIDQYLCDYPGIEDAAAFGFEDGTGTRRLAVALVVADDFDLKALQATFLQQFGASRQPSLYVRLKHIPRNQMGKVMRGQLSSRLAEPRQGGGRAGLAEGFAP